MVCNDFSGYKASFELGATELGYLAQARRKFFELRATNKSQLAEQALRCVQWLYEIESVGGQFSISANSLNPSPLRIRLFQQNRPIVAHWLCLASRKFLDQMGRPGHD